MVGELRLWLSLIIETEEKYMDIYTKPLLPNLSFKIRQGDSLIEEIGGVQINLRKEKIINLSNEVQEEIKKLIDKKRAFFSGQISADLKEINEIEKLEQQIFSKILNSKIKEIKQQIQHLEKQKEKLKEQKDIFGNEDKIAKEEEKELNIQIIEKQNQEKIYKDCLKNLQSKKQKNYFLWEIDFAEVFSERGGFDIVIGNPPYVRQELIAPPLENQQMYREEEWKKKKTNYKEKLISSVMDIWESVKKIDKKSDLYVYFYYHGISLLKEKGIFCFINSNSWLDVGYGAGLQEFLLKNTKLLYIIDNLKQRSFKQADVNTVIVVVQRPLEKLKDYTLKFVALKKSFADVINAEFIKKIEEAKSPIFHEEEFRVYPKTKQELLLEGLDTQEENLIEIKPENLPYISNKWGGKYLRAPEIYFKILEKGKGKLVKLGDIAEVKFGIKTGANQFFYLKPIGMSVKGAVEIAEKNPNTLIKVKNSAGYEGKIEAEFLKPVVKSPRELKTILVRLEDLNYFVFMCHKSEKELKGTKALEYIKWGEKQKYHNRPSCKGRNKWWDLGSKTFALCEYPMINYDRLIVSYNSQFYSDANLVGIYPKFKEFNNHFLVVSLNFSFGMIYWELYGISNLGEGAIKQNPIYFKNFYVFNPNLFTSNDFEKLKEHFTKISMRNILSIFTELGFDPKKSIREQEPNPLPDRKALDDLVFDVLELTEEERKEVYWSVAELVKNRLEKARNVD